MRILAVAPSCKSFPIGLSYIVAVMRKAGYEVDCLNMTNVGELSIERGRYDVVATGGLACHFKEIVEIARVAREAGSKVVVGGGIITAEPDFVSQHVIADHYVLGEGETAILHVLDGLRNGREVERFVKGETIEDLDALPFPDYDSFGYGDIFDKVKSSDAFFTDVLDDPRAYPVLASRSCPYRCTFCYSPLGNKYRQRSVDSIIDELMTVIPKYRINIVQMLDELFSYDEDRVYEFCSKFNEMKKAFAWEIKWGGCLRVDRLKPEMMDILKASGFEWVQYGFESYSETVLKSMKKNIRPAQIRKAVELALEKKIRIVAAFIFGDRAETLETAKETLSFWKDHAEVGVNLTFILPLPNSELYQYCNRTGIIKDKLQYYTHGLFEIRNMTSMGARDFDELQRNVFTYFHRYTKSVVPEKVTATSMSAVCPHCRELQSYNNYSVYDDTSALFPSWTKGLFYFKQVYCRGCTRKFMVVSTPTKLLLKLAVFLYRPGMVRAYRRLSPGRSEG